MNHYTQFKALRIKQKAYDFVLAIAGWDANTEAPKASVPLRAEMVGFIAGEAFALKTSREYIDVVEALLSHLDTLSDAARREIELAKRELDKIVFIPRDEYVAFIKLVQLSQHVWEDAKEKSDYSVFKPFLQKIIAAKKRMVEYRNLGKAPYDVCLDDFEEGMDMVRYDAFFATLKENLVPFVKDILKRRENHPNILTECYEKDKQRQFVTYLMDVFGYDKNAGLLKESVHPFTWNTHSKDVRFTVRYLEHFLPSSIFAGIHELGHALYEQQIDERYDTSPLGGGASMALHESQSRFYENIIGRSIAFWETHYDVLKNLFPAQLETTDAKTFHRAVNHVSASFIRVEADELTYSLHIMLRYEMERMIFNDNIDLDDLPGIWNRLAKEYLGIDVKNDADGILQDVHWSGGSFGYFPTYALGSAIAAQIHASMKEDLDIDALIRKDNILAINGWLKTNMHQFGKRHTPDAMIQRMTGEAFNPTHYIRYLKEKYGTLYEGR